jgi:hypothetical protein
MRNLPGMRRVLGLPTWQLLVVLVGVSAAFRATFAETIPTPWIAPDELIYAELGRAFWSTGHLTLFGQPTRFFSFVSPVLAGLPLSLHDRETGYRLLQTLQAVVMSLAAVPVYLWARSFVTRGWGLVAAALALVPPSLAYSGLVMTEVAFYPAFVLAAWAVWRALDEPTPRRQAWALAAIVLLCAVRLQGFVVGLAYLTAIAFDRGRFRRHAPVVAGFAVVGLLWCAWQLRHGGPVTKVLGAYQAAGETHYAVGATLRFVLYHLADVVLITGVVPVVALGLLRGRDVRSFRTLTLVLTAWLALQVGVFASRHIGHTAERNLFGLIPLYGIACVVWIARGAPRPRVRAAALAVACLGLLLVFPFERFSTLTAAPSNFTLVAFYDVASGVDLDLVVPLLAAVLLVACLFAPRVTLPVLFVLGIVGSVAAGRLIAREARAVRALTLGEQKAWIDRRVDADVAFLYTPDLNWEIPWESAFWNPRIRTVYGLLGAQVAGGMPQRTVGPFEDGSLVFPDGKSAPAAFAVASDHVQVVGRRLGDSGVGYALWKVEPPFRIASWVTGLDGASYSALAQVDVSAYACRPSVLRGTLVSSENRAVEVLRNGEFFERIDMTPNVGKQLAVPAAVPGPDGTRLCTFTLRGDGPFFARGLSVA